MFCDLTLSNTYVKDDSLCYKKHKLFMISTAFNKYSCNLYIDQKYGITWKMIFLSLQAEFSTKFKVSESPKSHCQIFWRSLNATLRKKCPYPEFFWSVYSRICTEHSEHGTLFTKCKSSGSFSVYKVINKEPYVSLSTPKVFRFRTLVSTWSYKSFKHSTFLKFSTAGSLTNFFHESIS